MESIEEIAERIATQIPEFVWSEGCGYECGVLLPEAIAFAEYLKSDPAFRRLMAEELVKVDMEPQRSKYLGVLGFTQDQVTAAVLKEREAIAAWLATQRLDVPATGAEFANALRSRTERTE